MSPKTNVPPVGRALPGATGAPIAVGSLSTHHEDARDKLIRLSAETYSAAANYDNVVIIAGYAAFFTLWAGTSGDLPRVCRLVTVALMGASLLFYISWHMLQMLTRQYHEFKRAAVFKFMNSPAKFNSEWVKAAQAQDVATNKILRFWIWLFVPSVALGFAGGIVLTYNALAAAFGWPVLTG